MNCTKHPHMKMSQLFTSWVCDACDPPKSFGNNSCTEIRLDWQEKIDRIPWETLGFEGKNPDVLALDLYENSRMRMAYMSDMIFELNTGNYVRIRKSRWGAVDYNVYVPRATYEDLFSLSISVFSDPLTGQSCSKRLVYVKEKRA